MFNRKAAKTATDQSVVFLIISLLELVNLFQTFKDLESIKDKHADTQAVRQLIDEGKPSRSTRKWHVKPTLQTPEAKRVGIANL